MKHTSIRLDSPIEFIESTKVSPFISKVQIKVCYVGDEPNRNYSVISKETARKLAPSLRGCPIVGFYNESRGDFEEHNRQINISNGEWRITDTTVPYGFVDLNAKLWFATYLDDDEAEHEYLCTEGYIWDHAYPEAKRILEHGNNQSMELDEETLDATWSKDENGKPEFFIINEALISKLCILGEDCEPCFEGAQIATFSLVVDDSFQQKLFSMIRELKDLIKEGGTKVFNTYAVEIGDTLWSALYDYIAEAYPAEDCPWCSKYSVDGIFEEDGQKFAILRDKVSMKYYRLNFSLTEENGFAPEENLVEVTVSYTPASVPQFDPVAVQAYEAEYAQKKEEENSEIQDKNDEEDQNNSEESIEEDSEEEVASEEEEPTEFSVTDSEEYKELAERFSALETQVSELTTALAEATASAAQLTAEITPLREFKKTVERKEKEGLINKFYMLSDEDKKDVIDNIDSYSLDDIEAKLSIICVRNKVSFSEDDTNDLTSGFTFKVDEEIDDSATPAWVKAVLNTAKTME